MSMASTSAALHFLSWPTPITSWGFAYDQLTEEGKTYVCVPHVNVHHRVTSAEEDFNDQGNRMAHSIHTSHHLSPATSVIDQWAQKQSSHGGRVGDYAWFQQHRLPLTKANLVVATTECPICHQQRPILSLLHGIIS